MRLFEIPQFGIEHLNLTERPAEGSGPGEVVVKMRAASLNYRDLMVVKGLYNPKMKLPMVPLSDGVGVVQETGAGVTRVKRGDRVAGIFMQKWIDGRVTPEKVKSALGGAIDGVLREDVVFSEEGLVVVPEHLTDEEAAALPCAGVTAWHALMEHTQMVPGETVLLLGTGGVSIFALQFAKAAGLRTIITSSSDEKLARAKALGADETINYKSVPDWDEQARKLTGGVGVDHVIEVGGSGTMAKSLKAVRMQGTVTVIGVLGGVENAVGPRALLMNSLRVQGIYVGSRAMFERMNGAISAGKIRPVVDKVFGWTEFGAALRFLESGQHFGKICLRF